LSVDVTAANSWVRGAIREAGRVVVLTPDGRTAEKFTDERLPEGDESRRPADEATSTARRGSRRVARPAGRVSLPFGLPVRTSRVGWAEGTVGRLAVAGGAI
jgi:hypothetical protein